MRGIEAEVRLSPSVNYAMQQNDVRFVHSIVLRNTGLRTPEPADSTHEPARHHRALSNALWNSSVLAKRWS